jgi:hypothetical protein
MNFKYVNYSIITAWSLLGFNRGMNLYNFNNQKYLEKPTYLYSVKFLYGALGFGVYINPIFLFMTIPKEIYRLEVVLRGLEDEKKTHYYNVLL